MDMPDLSGPLIADGGLATELEARGHDLSDALRSARLSADDPDAIRAAHLALYRAGARIAPGIGPVWKSWQKPGRIC